MAQDRTSIPSAQEIRASMPDAVRRNSYLTGFLMALPGIAVYTLSVIAIVVTPFWAWLLLIPLAALGVTMMFVVSHDAAHDSLTPSRTLNRFLARVLFLPSWHSCSGWIHAHNHVHHGWTNYQPRDYVWSPMSLEEYEKRSAFGKWWVRLCRSWPGYGFYYGVEVLLKKILVIQPEVKQPRMRRIWMFDNLLVLSGAIGQAALTIYAARAAGIETHPAVLILGTQVIPGMLAQWIVGFLTYLHHTQPSTPWFNDIDQWSFYMGQVRGTTHISFPKYIDRLLFNIMEHTAHHVDQRIPLYKLEVAQAALEESYDPVHFQFGYRNLLYTQRVCQLYDFKEHYWLSYDGKQTSSRTVSEELLNRVVSARRGRRSNNAAVAVEEQSPEEFAEAIGAPSVGGQV